MNITRQHYEEYFLLYVDNELTDTERKAVEAFVEENPDLGEELIMLQQSVIKPDQRVVFDDKGSLLKKTPDTNPVNETNCEEYFVLYGDDELTNQEKDFVEQFVYRNPQYQESFELVQAVRLTPDPLVTFPGKRSLYRHETERRVIAIRWWKIAAAAILLMFIGGTTWFTMVRTDKPANDPVKVAGQPAGKDTAKPGPAVTSTDTDHREQTEKKPATPVTPLPEGPVIAEAPKKISPSSSDKQTKGTAIKLPETNAVPETSVAIAKTDGQEKKSVEASNSLKGSSVLPVEDATHAVAVTKPVVKVADPVIDADERKALAMLDNKLDNKPSSHKIDDLVSEDTEQDQFTTDTGKKNRLRGLFRRVTRVFERNTNMDHGDNNKGSIRIASFEIALK